MSFKFRWKPVYDSRIPEHAVRVNNWPHVLQFADCSDPGGTSKWEDVELAKDGDDEPAL